MLSLLRISLCLFALSAAADACCAQPWERRDLHSFGRVDDQAGLYPQDLPILGPDGIFYGTTEYGGTYYKGVLYRFDPADRAYRVLHHFTGLEGAAHPAGTSLVRSSDGWLYGLARGSRLVLYRCAPDGTGFRVLFTFPPGAEVEGGFALLSWLREGPDGRLYGVYTAGGINSGLGQLFRIQRDGSGFLALGTQASVSGPLTFGADGRLFGTTGTSVFRLEPDGTGTVTLKTFPVNSQLGGGVLHHSNGFLYGFTSSAGPARNFSMLFRLRPDGSEYSVLFEAPVSVESGHLRGPCFESDDGFIYGSVGEDNFGTESFVWRIRPDGSAWQVLKRMRFNNLGTMEVRQGRDGFLYGIGTGPPQQNSIFRLARDGSQFEVLRVFGEDDGQPLTPIALVRGADQRFYGLTDYDGAGRKGTLFRLSPDGSNFTVLHEFGSGPPSGQGTRPRALCATPDGSICGVVQQLGEISGGIFRFEIASGQFSWIQQLPGSQWADFAGILCGSDGLIYASIDTVGTNRIVRLQPDGAGYTVLRTFTGQNGSPLGTGALTEGPDGRLYGITTRNGSSPRPLLFRLARDGSGFENLGEVTSGSGGAAVASGLLVTPAGQIFAFARDTLFRCQADGSGYTVLHTFPSNPQGNTPLLGFDGRIYGVTRFSAFPSGGTFFAIRPDGSAYEELVTFPYLNDQTAGNFPLGICPGPDGAFYGLAAVGGLANRGTLFRLSAPAQLVGLVSSACGFDARGRFTGAVSGPPGRPVDVWRSDDLISWTLLQRLPAPEVDPTFRDTSTLPGRRFYRATAP